MNENFKYNGTIIKEVTITSFAQWVLDIDNIDIRYKYNLDADIPNSNRQREKSKDNSEVSIIKGHVGASFTPQKVKIVTKDNKEIGTVEFEISDIDNIQEVRLSRAGIVSTNDEVFWTAIKSKRLDFNIYKNFINDILCNKNSNFLGDTTNIERTGFKNRSPFIGVSDYSILKFATEAYMLKMFGIDNTHLNNYLTQNSILPYYEDILAKLDDVLVINKVSPNYCDEDVNKKLKNPFLIELIWSYWMEQGMLVQTMNLISMRFQNMRVGRDADLMTRFDADPLNH